MTGEKPIFAYISSKNPKNRQLNVGRVPHEMKDSIVNLATAAKREIHATRNVGRKRKRSSAFSRVSALGGSARRSPGKHWQGMAVVVVVTGEVGSGQAVHDTAAADDPLNRLR